MGHKHNITCNANVTYRVTCLSCYMSNTSITHFAMHIPLALSHASTTTSNHHYYHLYYHQYALSNNLITIKTTTKSAIVGLTTFNTTLSRHHEKTPSTPSPPSPNIKNIQINKNKIWNFKSWLCSSGVEMEQWHNLNGDQRTHSYSYPEGIVAN